MLNNARAKYRMSNPKQTKKQFNEVDFDMISDHNWSKAKIDEFRAALAASYGVLPAEIRSGFAPITDVSDDDRRNCIYLCYYMKREMAIGGQTVTSDTDRMIYRVEMPVTEDIKKIAATRSSGKTPFNSAPALRPIAMLPTAQSNNQANNQQPQINVIRPKRAAATTLQLPPSTN